SDLLKTAQGHTSASSPVQTAAQPQAQSNQTLLIVDDSITTRTLEKNILEAAGFEVITATNGLEALDTLDKTPIALVVADIEMPYMDGFELTARIRQSDRFSQLPLILVTSLDTEKHTPHGWQPDND